MQSSALNPRLQIHRRKSKCYNDVVPLVRCVVDDHVYTMPGRKAILFTLSTLEPETTAMDGCDAFPEALASTCIHCFTLSTLEPETTAYMDSQFTPSHYYCCSMMATVPIAGAVAMGALTPEGKEPVITLNTTGSRGWVIHLSGGGWGFLKNTSDPPLKCAPGALAAGDFLRVANTTLSDAVAFCKGNVSCAAFTAHTSTFSNGGKDACSNDTGVHQFYFKSDGTDGNGDPTWHTWSKPNYVAPLYFCSKSGKCTVCPPETGSCARETYADQECFGWCPAPAGPPPCGVTGWQRRL